MSRNVFPYTVVAGNPVRVICFTKEYVERYRQNMERTGIMFEKRYQMRHGKLAEDKKIEIINKLDGKIGYIR